MPSIKVLAISPYPGMVPLLTETAKEYDGLELTISVGDLAKGRARLYRHPAPVPREKGPAGALLLDGEGA